MPSSNESIYIDWEINLVAKDLSFTGVDKYRKEAEERGKAGFELAYVMDNLKEERERGVTIDVAHKEFKTDTKHFTIIDAQLQLQFHIQSISVNINGKGSIGVAKTQITILHRNEQPVASLESTYGGKGAASRPSNNNTIL